MRAHLLFLIAAAIAAGAGCATRTSRVVEPRAPFDSSALVTRVTISDREIAHGELTHIRVAVRNPTGGKVVLQFESGCTITFAIVDAKGEVVAPAVAFCTDEAPTVVFPAFRDVVREFTWDGSSGPGRYLAPGDYFVVGGLNPGAEDERSDPLPIRVVAP